MDRHRGAGVRVLEGLDRVEGVPRGSTALFLKIHHAVMDGKSALRLMTGLHSLDPEPGSPTLADSMPDEKPIDKNFRAPSWWAKYGRAWWHSIERPIDMATTLAAAGSGLGSGGMVVVAAAATAAGIRLLGIP